MPIAASITAIVLTLVPVAVVLASRARRERSLWAAALDIPLTVAVDLLLVLSLSRFVTLETATVASRVLWLGGGIGRFVVRSRAIARPAWPQAANARVIVTAALAGGAASYLSTLGSRPYSIWDRLWHTPLVASLRGQSTPFDNVFQRGEVLHYHFAGDVHAAMIQTLSRDTIHASLALSLAHDLLFGLIGISLALLLAGLGGRRVLPAVLVTLAVLLAGPYTVWRDPAQPHIDGYSIFNYFSMSFRPHDALAGIFFVGVAGALAARVAAMDANEPAPVGDTVPALIASAAGLSISDETSLGLFGLSLGLTWLVFPRVLHPRRAVGAAILVGLVLAFLGPNLAFAAAIAPGAQRHTMALAAWRSPGCANPTLLLDTRQGMAMLLADLGPTALLCLGGVLGAIAARRRSSAQPIAVFAAALFALSALALTHLEVNENAGESHRFMTAGVFLAPMLALLVLRSRAPRWPLLRGAAVVTAAIGATLGAASTVDWIVHVVPNKPDARDPFFTKMDLYAVDCRRDFGVKLGARALPIYLSKTVWYAYAGCQSTFAPGRRGDEQWALTIGAPYFEKDALRALHADLRSPDDKLTVVCPRGAAATEDPVCVYAVGKAPCHNLGTRAIACELSSAQQAELAR